MPNFNILKRLFLISAEEALSGPTTLYYQDIEENENALPTGWTSSGFDVAVTGDGVEQSNGYDGASAGQLIGHGGFSEEAITINDSISTVGITGMTLSWGAQRFADATSPTLEYNADGGGWTSISYTDATANATWQLVEISLPIGCEGASNLQFRITFQIGSDVVNPVYLLDDFKITY